MNWGALSICVVRTRLSPFRPLFAIGRESRSLGACRSANDEVRTTNDRRGLEVHVQYMGTYVLTARDTRQS